MRLCKDCKHSYGYSAAPECDLPAQDGEKIDPATGAAEDRFAKLRREYGACGVEGRYWEAKRLIPSVLSAFLRWVDR